MDVKHLTQKIDIQNLMLEVLGKIHCAGYN
jgi:hypothetical protein